MPPPYDRLKEKVALITGAGRGIGRALALGFAAEGADLVLCSRTPAELARVREQVEALGRGCLAVEADVTIPEDVERLVQAALARFGRVDVLVNNAGSTVVAPSDELALADWRRVVEINQDAVFALTQRVAAAAMLPAGRGAILNIASLTSFVGYPGRAAYAASKGAILSLTRVLAVEWAPRGVRVNALAPGMIATELQERLVREGKFDVAAVERRVPLGRRGQPEELVPAAVFLVSDESAYVTGTVLAVDGGYLANGYWH